MNRYHDVKKLKIPPNVDVEVPFKYVNGLQLFNIYYYLKYENINLIHILGARSIGKTYDVFEMLYLNRMPGKEFLLVKTTTNELERITTKKGNPYNDYCNKNKLYDSHGKPLITIEKNEAEYLFVEKDMDGNTVNIFGRAIALLSGSRGVDYSSVDLIFYDEFIPDPGVIVRNIGEQYEAWLFLLDSVIRNRDVWGEDLPLCICASNSTELGNNLTVGLGLVSTYEKMRKKGTCIAFDKYRNILSVYPDLKEFTEAKKKTWLYRLAHGSDYVKMALENDFSYNSFWAIHQKKLVEYRPVVRVDNVTFFKHKTIKNKWYACQARADCEVYNKKDTIDIFYKRYYIKLRDFVYDGHMEFSDFETKKLVLDIFGNIQKYRKKK